MRGIVDNTQTALYIGLLNLSQFIIMLFRKTCCNLGKILLVTIGIKTTFLSSIIKLSLVKEFGLALYLKHIKSFKLSSNEFMKILINLSSQKQYLTVYSKRELSGSEGIYDFIQYCRRLDPIQTKYRFIDKF